MLIWILERHIFGKNQSPFQLVVEIILTSSSGVRQTNGKRNVRAYGPIESHASSVKNPPRHQFQQILKSIKYLFAFQAR